MAYLHAVTGRARKCGPSAIATVLGCTTDEAARMLRKATGRKAINRCTIWEMMEALRLAGCQAKATSQAPSPTMRQWSREHHDVYRSNPTIVLHGGKAESHFGTFLGNEYLCVRTGFERVSVIDLPKPRAKVEGWIEITQLPSSALEIENTGGYDVTKPPLQLGRW